MQLTLSVSVLFHVPDGVQLVVVLVADDLVLVKAPFREDLAGELESLSGADVNQLDLGSDRLPEEEGRLSFEVHFNKCHEGEPST